MIAVHAVGYSSEVPSAITRHRQPAAARVEAPWFAAKRVHSGVKDSRVLRIDVDIRTAAVFINEQRLRPGLTAVRCFEDTALFVRSPRASERSDISDIRVARINLDSL